MKLHRLKAVNFRGLVSFEISPKGRSIVLSGPNGCGKTATVEAIEFVLTGALRRFEGRGAGALSLRKHGRHIEHLQEDAVVEVDVSLPSGARFRLTRKMSDPEKLECQPPPTSELEHTLALAARGHHALSRSQLLQFITVTPGDRAKAVQQLLAIDRIEELDGLAATLGREDKAATKHAEQAVRDAEREFAVHLGLSGLDGDRVAEVLNRQLDTLGLAHVTASFIDLPALVAPRVARSRGALQADIEQLLFLCETADGMAQDERAIVEVCSEFAADPQLTHELDQHDLLAASVPLLGDASRCPLCQATWQPADLRALLRERQERSKRAGSLLRKIGPPATRLREVTSQMASLSDRLARKAPEDKRALLAELAENARKASKVLTDPRSAIDSQERWQPSTWLLQPERRQELRVLANDEPNSANAEQGAVIFLSEARVRIQQMQSRREELAKAEADAVMTAAFRDAVQSARNEVLGGLYDEIESVFSRLYRCLHDDERDSFEGELHQDKNGLVFTVDFHSKGKHPPAALHSEGHQDSIGLCLYLALMRRLIADSIQLTVLDDVVMSVDAGHRRNICELLKAEFPDRQFVITTHDPLWAKQLEHSAVVSNRVVLQAWTLQNGPIVATRGWDKIEQLLAEGDANLAAAALRYVLEEELADACDHLGAKVRYRGNGLYGFNELFEGVKQRFPELLEKARVASAGRGRSDAPDAIEEVRARFDSARRNTQLEQWILNQTVHHNAGWTANVQDLRPLVDAARSLSWALRCECGSSIAPKGPKGSELLACGCGRIAWPLTKANAAVEQAA